MKYISALMTKGSGSIRGITASNNRGGTYFRGRTTPTNPNTSRQASVRAALRQAVNNWTTLLTALQRTGWTTYAANVPTTDSLGNTITLTGQQMYLRTYTVRSQASLTAIAAAPGIFDLGTFTPPTLALAASATTGTLTFTAGDAWVDNSTNSAMIIWTSAPQNPSVNFFKGPFQFAGKILGTNSTGTATFNLPIAAGVAGSRTFFKISVSRADGRLSQPFLGIGVTA